MYKTPLDSWILPGLHLDLFKVLDYNGHNPIP